MRISIVLWHKSLRIELKIWVMWIIVLGGSLCAISAVIKSKPRDLPNGNLWMNVFISFGVKDFGGNVSGSGFDKNWLISSSLGGRVSLG